MPQPAPGPADGRRRQKVALVGLMGTGKSTIGRLLATHLGRTLLDNDALLEQRRGATAAELGERFGLDAMHAFEDEVLGEQLAWPDPVVITAAAHPLVDPDARRRLHDVAVVVWLRADAAVLAARIGAGATRPAVTGTTTPTADEVVTLAHDRQATFEAVADIVIDTSTEAASTSVQRIVDAVRPYGIEATTE